MTSRPGPTPAPKQSKDAASLRLLLQVLTAALALVAVLALVFSAVNVTRLAVRHGIPAGIAWLLDPMVSVALTASLIVDARLAEHGVRPPAWSTVLRWYTGLATLAMNTWTSWGHDPTDPGAADPAGVSSWRPYQRYF